MYFVLCENVYIVNGNKNSCIYDLNNSKLLLVNKALSERIVQINNGLLTEDDIDEELKTILEQFIIKGIVMKAEQPFRRDIKELSINSDVCDFAWIEITNKCNLRCRHCYNESQVQCENVMKISDFKRVIDNLIEMKISKIQIIGGEPFYYESLLKDMLDYAIGKFGLIEIFTNGTCIKDDWFDYLKKNGIRVALSVYSYEDNMHDKVTGVQGSLKKTIFTIEKLKQCKIPYRVCNVLMKDIELGEPTSKLFELSKEKDVVRMSGRANFSLLSDELIKKKLITKEYFKKPITKDFVKRLVSGHNCFKNKIYISSDLSVYPCVMERRIKHCNINEKSIIELNEDIRNLTKDNIKDCSICEYRYACHDCRPNSLDMNILGKPWYCTYSPSTGEWTDVEIYIKRLREMYGEGE